MFQLYFDVAQVFVNLLALFVEIVENCTDITHILWVFVRNVGREIFH